MRTRIWDKISVNDDLHCPLTYQQSYVYLINDLPYPKTGIIWDKLPVNDDLPCPLTYQQSYVSTPLSLDQASLYSKLFPRIQNIDYFVD